jgi:hypothetical protein
MTQKTATPRPAAKGAETKGARATPAKTRSAPPAAAGFDWQDPLELEGELSEDERMVLATARGYAQDRLFPRVLTAFLRASDAGYREQIVSEPD